MVTQCLVYSECSIKCLKEEKKLVRDMKAVAIWVNMTRTGKMLGLRDL